MEFIYLTGDVILASALLTDGQTERLFDIRLIIYGSGSVGRRFPIQSAASSARYIFLAELGYVILGTPKPQKIATFVSEALQTTKILIFLTKSHRFFTEFVISEEIIAYVCADIEITPVSQKKWHPRRPTLQNPLHPNLQQTKQSPELIDTPPERPRRRLTRGLSPVKRAQIL
ncbi:hypothetical protein T310_7417, partial [Rasamsonia emersonii CBS 393.64]